MNSFIPHNIPLEFDYYYPHFPDTETEAPRSPVTCPRSLSKAVGSRDLSPAP